MGYRTDIRLPAASGLFSTTSTTLATLTVPAVTGKKVCVTGYGLSYNTAFTTAVQPALLDGANVMLQMGPILTATTVQHFIPVCGSRGNSVSLRTTVSSVSVVNLSLQYFYDD